MISDSEFVMIKAFDRTIDQRDGQIAQANAIIRRKNTLLAQHANRINALEAALGAERRKTAALAEQLKRFMAMH